MKMIMIPTYFKVYLFMIILMMSMILLLFSLSMKNIHPLTLGLILLIYSILISLNLNMFNKSSIYSMMMFLIIIGGFLILFLYFNSFAINNKMILNMNSFNLFSYKMFLLMFTIMFIIYKNNLFTMIIFLNNKILEMKSFLKMLNNKNNNINMIYLKFKNLVMFMISYLLIVLMIIMKIIFYSNPKTMRQMMN